MLAFLGPRPVAVHKHLAVRERNFSEIPIELEGRPTRRHETHHYIPVEIHHRRYLLPQGHIVKKAGLIEHLRRRFDASGAVSCEPAPLLDQFTNEGQRLPTQSVGYPLRIRCQTHRTYPHLVEP